MLGLLCISIVIHYWAHLSINFLTYWVTSTITFCIGTILEKEKLLKLQLLTTCSVNNIRYFKIYNLCKVVVHNVNIKYGESFMIEIWLFNIFDFKIIILFS